MDANRYLRTLCALIWLLVVLHVSAEAFYLYWTFFWYDYLTHFLGGMWVGLATLWLWVRAKSGFFASVRLRRYATACAVTATLAVGLLWELYEYVVWTQLGTGVPVNYVADTLIDLTMDVCGGVVGIVLALRLSRSLRALLQPSASVSNT